MKKDQLKTLIKSIITEVKSVKSDNKQSTTTTFNRDVDNNVDKTAESLVGSIKTTVKKINKSITVEVTSKNDIMVCLSGSFYIKIVPKWSNNYDVEAYRNMSDRIFAPGLDDKRVLEFIKANFSENKSSYVKSSYDKSTSHSEDKTTKRDKDLPKVNPVKEKAVPSDEVESSAKKSDEDQSAPLKSVDVKKIEKQSDHDVEKNKTMPKIQKMIKKEVDDDLTKSWKK